MELNNDGELKSNAPLSKEERTKRIVAVSGIAAWASGLLACLFLATWLAAIWVIISAIVVLFFIAAYYYEGN